MPPHRSRRSEIPAQHKKSTMQKAKLLQPDTIIRRKKMTIYICGDSTAATYPPENAPITGWGQLLGDYLPNVNVFNKAVGGRSTKSFLAEGRLTDIERTIQPGDLLVHPQRHQRFGLAAYRPEHVFLGESGDLCGYGAAARRNPGARHADSAPILAGWRARGRARGVSRCHPPLGEEAQHPSSGRDGGEHGKIPPNGRGSDVSAVHER